MDKITKAVERVKRMAHKDGSVKIAAGVWLITGKEAIEETADYRDAIGTDELADGYTVEDITPDELYIQTNDGYFGCADDKEIAEILKQEGI